MRILSCIVASVLASLLANATLLDATHDARQDLPTSPASSDDCPKACQDVGSDTSKWSFLHDIEAVASCTHDVLFSFNIHSEVLSGTVIRACSLQLSARPLQKQTPPSHRAKKSLSSDDFGPVDSPLAKSFPLANPSCGARRYIAPVRLTPGATLLDSGADAAHALGNLANHFIASPACGARLLFSKSGSAYVGIFIGADILTSDAGHVFDEFKTKFQDGIQSMQVCSTDQRLSYIMGAFAVDHPREIDFARRAVRTWAQGSCLQHQNVPAIDDTLPLTILVSSFDTYNSSSTAPTNNTTSQAQTQNAQRRAECRAIAVESGDSCAALASRCKIRGADFIKYNKKDNLCSTLTPGQYVCCSAGTIPDATKPPEADGSCKVATVGPTSTCDDLAQAHGLTVKNFIKLNERTWGWVGCNRLLEGQRLCVSKGTIPMPNQLPDVACGPQKIGTKKPSGNFDPMDLEKLNPCPLNACCSGWGYCGLSKDFCTIDRHESKAPGAFKANSNGCLSNCGMSIVGNKNKPASFSHVAYFQGYNPSRNCLRMDAGQILDNLNGATHIHFAFAVFTEDYRVRIPEDTIPQFQRFVRIQGGVKKILSFGGWAASTEPGSYHIFRNAVLPGNRKQTATNVVQFLNSKNLQGVDFDWEYPGTYDIPGVPPGPRSKEEGNDYLEFLKLVRQSLQQSEKASNLQPRSLSIAIPSSFWYLRGFPIAKIADVVDYMVFMTYDLHGQWDYGNKFTNPGCPNGNCLRSHINKTETESALVLATKAGVPASKLFVGISSYGRSFRMADPKCTSVTCEFTGSFSQSNAMPGRCTETSGYISDAELQEIWDDRRAGDSLNAVGWHDADSDSDIMVYGGQGQGITDWVGFMNSDTKKRRIDWIRDLNMGGVTDWAMDLAEFHTDSTPPGEGGGSDKFVLRDLDDCDESIWPYSLEDADKNIDRVPIHCRGAALTNILVNSLEEGLEKYSQVSFGSDYDDKFGYYADWVKDAINSSIDRFMQIGVGKGLKYLNCKWSTRKTTGQGPCTEVQLPYDMGSSAGPRIVEFSMRDENGFFEALLAETGIEKDWVYWSDMYVEQDPCLPCPHSPCSHEGSCSSNYFARKHYPRRISDKSKIDISNPKHLIDDALPNLIDLANQGVETLLDMSLGDSTARAQEIILSLSMPIFMLEDAFGNIERVKKIGAEEKERKTRDLVVMILSIVFSALPFLGPFGNLVSTVGRLATAAMIIGEIGNVALAIEEIVRDANSAPFAILGIITGAAGIRVKGPRKGYQDAAEVRKSLPSDALKKFSPEFQAKDEIVQRMVKKCMSG